MVRKIWPARAGAALLVTLSAGAWATPAAAASTGTARVLSSTRIEFTAAGGRTNSVVLTRSGRTVTIDDRVKLKAGKGCKPVKGDHTKVRCTTEKNPAQVRVKLGNLNDTLVNKTSVAVVAYGGSGNDSLTGGSGADALHGENGLDRIWGGAGADVIHTGSGGGTVYDGPGNDRVHGGRGDDHFRAAAWTGRSDRDSYAGGGGQDRVSYASRTAPITADSDGVTGDDGQRGERDTIGAGIVAIEGGRGNDRLLGTAGYNHLFGGPGNDLLDGRGKDDSLYGGSGDDRLIGGAGWDMLAGEAGRDRLEGGADNDVLIGDQHDAAAVRPAADVMLGGSGTDRVIYSLHSRPVTVDLDGAAGDDGAAGERDTVGADVEDLFGSVHSDVLTGTDGDNLIGGGGSTAGTAGDVINGLGGNDRLLGGSQAETINGGAGDDVIDTGDDADTQRDTADGGPNSSFGDRCLTDDTDVAVDCELGS